LEEDGYIPKRDLATVQEVLYKRTARGLVKRSKVEQAHELDRLYVKKLERIKSGTEKKPDESFSGIMQEWLDYVESFRDVKTLKTYQRVRDIFMNVMKADPVPESKHFTRYTEELKKTMGDNSVNSYIRSLQAFFGWAHEQGRYFNEDRRKVKLNTLRVTTKEMGVYTDEQLGTIRERIQAKLDEPKTVKRQGWVNEMRVFVLVNLTGMRRAEIHSLKLDDINIGQSHIKIKDCEVTGFKVKGRREERVPISNDLASFLVDDLTARSQDEKWFLDNGKGAMYWQSEIELSKRFKKHQVALGIEGVKPLHGFRATVCTKLLAQGISPVIVQKLMRHRDINTTLRYLNTSFVSTQEAVEGLTLSGHQVATNLKKPHNPLKKLA